MRKPGTRTDDVQMSDVLCDFCHAEWTEDRPMLEGHQGSCVCGQCLSVAYSEVVLDERSTAPPEYRCPMCLETSDDRKALNRHLEGGWASPLHPEAVICRRCIDLAAKALERDPDFHWRRPK